MSDFLKELNNLYVPPKPKVHTVKIQGQNVVVTLEMQSNKVDYTDDFNEDFVFNILPRLSFTFKLNLEEQYPEFWENTDLGNLNAPDISLSYTSELITR